MMLMMMADWYGLCNKSFCVINEWAGRFGQPSSTLWITLSQKNYSECINKYASERICLSPVAQIVLPSFHALTHKHTQMHFHCEIFTQTPPPHLLSLRRHHRHYY